MAAAALALLSSLFWGTGDFLGGTLSRRANSLAVLRATQFLALVALVPLALASGQWRSDLAYLPWGLAAGVAGMVGLASFYAALAAGTMGVVAPVAATGVVVPVAVGLMQGESPSPAQGVGIVLAVVGVVLASRPAEDELVHPDHAPGGDRRPLLLALVAAVGFGSVMVFVAEGAHSSTVMTLTVMRTTNGLLASGVLALVTARAARARRPRPARPRWSDTPVLAVIAFTDTSANATFAMATATGLVSVSAVLASLYPAVTAVLAWRFHHERLARSQQAGVAAALVGVCLLAAGG